MSLINQDSIVFLTKQYTKNELFKFVCKRLSNHNLISNIDKTVSALLTREQVSDTRIDDLVAMPHCETATIKAPQIVFVNCRRFPIDWGDQNFVNGVVFLMIPTTKDDRVKQIPRLVQKLADPDVTNQLFNSDHSQSFVDNVRIFERR
ncbi:PTS sugar transporter subunit IIA [Lentilactobacillus kisonensis]|uniref:Phosphoenolpyruvate-dependent sugar phosphotransferase system, EIIA 2 n=2 Tax=Lentilactobacillus kisonensis TaxID=481722 RepID=H1LJ06_9LACO|nr:PTS sugar transporter subunit IIA [Lentilactobacillus kisonensis]EHO49433.1 phosphoenolpyruvate-dependent sugar phosphotransferase system, EIIA 2 [Lentilactobacillus kisonensis F0435]KRL22370.1 phosphoenolpyruvate-dependent sugar phosphotransferase system, EIIA 2 [Lentilactobacillus kisonensis DSM 19906 = JCM 15041]